MNPKRFGKRVARIFLSGFNFICPLISVLRANREMGRGQEKRSRSPEITALMDIGLRLDGASRAEVASAFAEDIARLRRLEDKLAWHFTVVALLLGVAAAIGGVALAQKSVTGLLLVVGAFVLLVSAGLLTLGANSAIRLYTPDVTEFLDEGDIELPKRLTGRRLQALRLNQVRGLQLSNTLFAAQRSLLVGVLFLVVGSAVTAASQLNDKGEPPSQVPQPSASSTFATPAPVSSTPSAISSSIGPRTMTPSGSPRTP